MYLSFSLDNGDTSDNLIDPAPGSWLGALGNPLKLIANQPDANGLSFSILSSMILHYFFIFDGGPCIVVLKPQM